MALRAPPRRGDARDPLRGYPGRLYWLLALAAVLAGTAVVVNVSYARRRAAARALARAAAASSSPAVDWQARIRELAEQLERDPANAAARFQLAEVYHRLGDPPRALAQLRLLERQRPADPEVFLRRAAVLKRAGDFNPAERAARRALALQPESVEARAWLGDFSLERGRAREALAFYTDCLKRQPEAAFCLLGKGRALEALFRQQNPVAIPDMVGPVEQAVRLQPDDPLGLLVLARMQFTYLKQPEAAEQTALRAARLEPHSAGSYILLAEIALSLPPTPQTLQRAGEYAYEGGRRNLREPRPPYQLGRLYLQQNDLPRAIKALERSVQLGALPEAVSQLAIAYRRAGNAERADHFAEVYQRHTERLERRDALLRQLARQRRGRGTTAGVPAQRVAVLRVLRLHLALAELYLEAGQPEIAENWLRAAHHLAPGDAHARQLRDRLRARQEKGGAGPLLRLE